MEKNSLKIIVLNIRNEISVKHECHGPWLWSPTYRWKNNLLSKVYSNLNLISLQVCPHQVSHTVIVDSILQSYNSPHPHGEQPMLIHFRISSRNSTLIGTSTYLNVQDSDTEWCFIIFFYALHRWFLFQPLNRASQTFFIRWFVGYLLVWIK